jgi:WD40 repeat protein
MYRRVAFDHRCLVTACSDHTLKCYDPTLQEEIATLSGHRGPVNDVDISRDNFCIVSASEDKTLLIWSTDTMQVPSDTNHKP